MLQFCCGACVLVSVCLGAMKTKREMFALLALAMSACQPEPAEGGAPPPASDPPEQPPAKRIVAIGDLHADLDNAHAALKLAGLLDDELRWSGGQTVLVQTGDQTDRGPDSRQVLALLDRLEEEAAAAGGQVIVLLGNHEVMNLTGDWRYVSPGDVATYGGEAARRAAFSAEGEAGRWLHQRDAVAQVDGVVFVHGGVSARYAAAEGGAAGLSDWVRRALAGQAPDEVLGPEGPLWYRGYLQAPEPVACAELEVALEALGAERMVMGHTTQRSGKIASRCEGRLLGIDTGISDHYGGHLAALEIIGGDAAALYPDGRVDLPDPATP